jgi:hypothetical protein
VEYLNFSKNGKRTSHHTRYKSIYMYNGMSWGLVHKGYMGKRNR